MPWLRFTADHNWKPTVKVTIAFKKGMVLFVTRACAAESIAKGKAVLTERPKCPPAN